MSSTPAQQGYRDGIAAYHAGIQCSPALDVAVTKFITANTGEHRRIRTYLQQWQRGWVETDLSATITTDLQNQTTKEERNETTTI